MKTLILITDDNGKIITDGLPVPNFSNSEDLTAGANTSHAVPEGAKRVFFSPSGGIISFYAMPNDEAEIPSGSITDGTASIPNPVCWELDGSITSIGLISAESGKIGLIFFK